jgi:hypothetical protein
LLGTKGFVVVAAAAMSFSFNNKKLNIIVTPIDQNVRMQCAGKCRPKYLLKVRNSL